MRGHRHRPDSCRSWRPGTAPTPTSRTGSKRSNRPGWAASRPGSSPSTPVWLQLALTAADLIAWTQTILLHGVLAKVEIKQLRYQLLHTAARIVRGQRKVRIKIDTSWPWAGELAAAFTRLAEIRQPLII